MAVEVHFCVTVSRDKCIRDDEIETKFDTYREALLENKQYYGAIITSSDGNPDIVVDDEVWATVQNLCFLAVPDLLAGRSVSIPYFRYGSSLMLTVKERDVIFAGEFIPTTKVPLQELLPAFYACGLRYVDFLRRLGHFDPEFSITADHLEKQSGIAKHALVEISKLGGDDLPSKNSAS